MENEKRIKIYPDMQLDRLQQFIKKEKQNLDQLINLEKVVADKLRSEGWLRNKIREWLCRKRLDVNYIPDRVINAIRNKGARLRSNKMVQDCIKELFNELITESRETNPKQSKLLQFVLGQNTKQGNLIVDDDRINAFNAGITYERNPELIFRTGMEFCIYFKFLNVMEPRNEKINELEDRIKKIERQIYVPAKKRSEYIIAPNITIRELPDYDSSGNYRCLEYHTDDKSLFFDEIKNGNLKRIKIEGVSLNNKSEFYGYTQKFIKKIDGGYFPSSAFHTFFDEEPIRQLLLRPLLNEHDDVIVSINQDFYGRDVGFAAIKTTEDDEPFYKIMFFQDKVNKYDKSKKCLHVVECGEILSEIRRFRFRTNEIKYLLEDLNFDLSRLFNYYSHINQHMTLIDIVKSGKIFELSRIKPYEYDLQIEYKLFDMNTQVQNPDDDIVKKHIENFINTQNTIQNTVRNVHIAGGPINTLLKVPYCCMDGLEIANNVPTIPFNNQIAAPKVANNENKKDAIKQAKDLKMATREVINELIDKSLGIKRQQ